MENEVSGIAKLGIVLIALAVLIGLGFGIFQISKGTANSGVTDVQKELDGVSSSQFTTYDQKVITGTMVRSAISDFEGESTAVLVSTQAWVNLMESTNTSGSVDLGDILQYGAGFNDYPNSQGTVEGGGSTKDAEVPIVLAYDKAFDSGKSWTKGGDAYIMTSSSNNQVPGCFINYNAILGSNNNSDAGVTSQQWTNGGTKYNMGGIYFDSNCFRCNSGFMTNASGKVLYNNVIGNLSKTGRTEFVPNGAKFQSYLIKDASGTTMGVAFQQINN